MELTFSSIEEVKEFVKQLKGTRGGKSDNADEATAGNAPAPLMPQTGQIGQAFGSQSAGAFAPPVGGATTLGGFPAAGAATLDPTIAELVNKCIGRIDGALQSGQPAENCRQWLAGQLASAGHPDASSATLDQIKQVYLPKMAAPWLSQIYTLMGGK